MSGNVSLTGLALYFAMLSLMAIGGVNVVLPDMHRQFVELTGWMSNAEFAALVALSQAAPGPNVLIVSLLGWKVGGLSGALIATAAICIPSSLLTYGFVHFWQKFEQMRWRAVVQNGLGPITVGLILASGYVLTHAAAAAASVAISAYGIVAVTAIVVLRTAIHPLWLLAAAALLGYSGVV